MSCCGKVRATASRLASSTISTGGSEGPATGAAIFEYRGSHVLTVIGQATGYPYRFVGFGARVPVHSSDRASLALVPDLREIRS